MTHHMTVHTEKMGSNYICDDERSLLSHDEDAELNMNPRAEIGEESDPEKFDSDAEKLDESEVENGDDEDSDNWDDEDGSDDSNAEDLLDYVESRFLSLVDEKIAASQNFCDHLQYVRSFAPQNVVHKRSSSEVIPEKEHKQRDIRDEGTQTEEAVTVEASDSDNPTNAVENPRKEVHYLRTARDSILQQKLQVAAKLKQDTVQEPDDLKKLYEFEEAIDAIDTVVDYKNELICERECTLTNDESPGTNEANLVTRLKNLSLLDLQRLVCKYFNKIVDLRLSTGQLEKLVVDLESKHEHISGRFLHNQRHVQELEEECEKRIKMILKHSENPTVALSDYLHYSKASKSARRKQYDLEMSLTELLVRHGYLSNGKDCEVNQVVKMLGIDTLQLRLYQMEDDDDWRKPSSGIPARLRSALGTGTGVPGLNLRLRDRIGGVDKLHDRNNGNDTEKTRDRSGGGNGRPREREPNSRSQGHKGGHGKGPNSLHNYSAAPSHRPHTNYNSNYSSHVPSSSTSRRPATNANGGYPSNNNNRYSDRARTNGHGHGHQPSSSHHHHGGDTGGHHMAQSHHFPRGPEVIRENNKIKIQVAPNHH